MNTIFKRAPVSFAILLVAMNGLAVAQNFGRGGFGPSPEMQAAAKAQTESATFADACLSQRNRLRNVSRTCKTSRGH